MADPAWEARISQISNRTFVLMERVVRTLKNFFDARSGSVARTSSSSSASSSSGASVPKSFQDKMRRLRYGAMML